jgi:2'-5' RNA ligase
MIRSFIALDLSPQVLANLAKTAVELKTRLAGLPVRWVAADKIHLTLKFLGEVSETNLERLYHILQVEAGKVAAFEMQVGEVGGFPSTSRPRVIWVGVQAPPALASLQRAIDLETAQAGYPAEERPFSPHLTLGRVGRSATPQDTRRIGELLSQVKVGSLGASLVEAVYFYRSDLKPDGPVYTRLHSAALRPS